MISYIFNKNRSEFKTCEDSLTSSIFDLLKYLPSKLFWEILKNSLYLDKLPNNSGMIKEFNFWSKFSANNTSNQIFVEPDIFIRFDKFDILLEAKRYNEKQQLSVQLENEIKSYFNDYNEDNKVLYFIKLGGLHNKKNEKNYVHSDNEVIICKTDWTRLLDSVDNKLKLLKNENELLNEAHIRILEDIIKSFSLHQYYKKNWLSDISKISINNHLILKKTFVNGK